MKIMDDNFDDYFEEGSVPKEKKTNVETAEQREERELRESTIERRYNKQRLALLSAAVLTAVLIIFWIGNRYFHVYEAGTERGAVMEIVNRGSLFKTYEGKMMTSRAYEDTVLYRTDFVFTIRDDSLAGELNRIAGKGKVIEVEYQAYKGSLPWRGESPVIVTGIKK